MELRHLLYFKTLAEELHFSKAAQKLHISQPPLSRQIKELETELGFMLFTRNNKKVEITDAGKYFLIECTKLIEGLEKSKNIAAQIHKNLAGEFKIGYISSTSKKILAKLIKQLATKYPNLNTRLYEISTQKQIKALEAGKLDIGIMRAPLDIVNLEIKHLFNDKYVIAIPKNENKTLNDIKLDNSIDFISYNKTYAPFYHMQLVDCCNRNGITLNIKHECNTISSMLDLVNEGLGYAIVPYSVIEQYSYLNLKFIEFNNNEIYTSVTMAYPKEYIHPITHEFIDLLQKEFKEVKKSFLK